MAKLKFFTRKECIRLTWFSRFLILFLLFVSIYIIVLGLPKYLSINKPCHGKIMVLDGQMPDYSIKKAIEIFNQNKYEMIVTTGGDLSVGYHISEIKSMARLTKATFIALDFDSTRIHAIPTGNVTRNRTYSSGAALKIWLDENNIDSTFVDILTIGFHARRSRLLFERALGNSHTIGVISIPDKTYDPEKWWDSSKGIRTMISETLGYFYSRYFFRP